MAEIDFLGSVSGYQYKDKFARSGLTARKSEFADAPVIEGCPVVIECELVEIVNGTGFSTLLAKIVNVACDEKVLNEKGRIDSMNDLFVVIKN